MLIGRSPAIEGSASDPRACRHPGDYLIVGETGTGKELVARCLHAGGSSRDPETLVALNCGRRGPESLFESEIFGHEPGAFTGASKRRIGKIQHAHKGTLFLDKIHSMPCALQVKLLCVRQEQEIERLGSNAPIAVDCRVVGSRENHLLASSSRQNRFRGSTSDYPFNVVPVELPPLRDRREDIPLLFEHFVLQATLRLGRDAPIISSAQMRELLTHNWPGNVRELHNIAIRFVLGLAGQTLVLGRSLQTSACLSAQMRQVERSLIRARLRKQNGCVAAASQALGLPKATLYDKIRKHRLASGKFGKVELWSGRSAWRGSGSSCC